MRISILLLALVLTACGHNTAPVAEAPAPVKQDPNAGCQVVTVLNVDGETTYMEVDGDAIPHARIARSGKWGNTGDRFRYCE